MTAAKKLNLISEQDYLESELNSQVKHEYLGGVVYAMAGARNRHNRIAVSILGALFGRLKGESRASRATRIRRFVSGCRGTRDITTRMCRLSASGTPKPIRSRTSRGSSLKFCRKGPGVSTKGKKETPI